MTNDYYYLKYVKYKKKYLVLKGGAESKSDPAANKPNLFYRFDENDPSQKRLPIHLQLGFIKYLTCEETKNLNN